MVKAPFLMTTAVRVAVLFSSARVISPQALITDASLVAQNTVVPKSPVLRRGRSTEVEDGTLSLAAAALTASKSLSLVDRREPQIAVLLLP